MLQSKASEGSWYPLEFNTKAPTLHCFQGWKATAFKPFIHCIIY
jgi:hypothetical protein